MKIIFSIALAFILVFPAGSVLAENIALSPAIDKLVKLTQQLIDKNDPATALKKLKEAEAITGRTVYDDMILSQLNIIAGVRAGQPAVAAKAFEFLANSPTIAPERKQEYLLGIADSYYGMSDSPAVIKWANRYLDAGGQSPVARLLLGLSYYRDKQYSNAMKVARDVIASDEAANRIPREDVLKLLASSAYGVGDGAVLDQALVRLCTFYSKSTYWNDMVHRIKSRPGFSPRLSLDASRLQMAAGGMENAVDFVEYAELAANAGFPGEAKKVIDKGFASGKLGVGPDAARHEQLRNSIRKNSTDYRIVLGNGVEEAIRTKDGEALLNYGLAYYGYDQNDKAISLIEQVRSKGVVKDQAMTGLHLGIVYLAAGKRVKAVDLFKSVNGDDGAADLARLWIVLATRT